MSNNKKYSNFFNNKQKNKAIHNEYQVEKAKESVEKIEEVKNDVVAEEIKIPTEISTIGIVDGCDRLFVRKGPSKEFESLCIIDKASSLAIDLKNSTDDFYKVKTSNGVEGYCMKKFIIIK